MKMRREVIGIDIGGTNLRVVRMGDDLTITHKGTVRIGQLGSREVFLEQLAAMVHRADPSHETLAIGIAFPAPFRKGQEILDDITNITYLEGLTIGEIKNLLPGYAIYLDNDVNVIALLEAHAGAAARTEHSVYITVSTGIGSGAVIDGEIYHGARGYAGEIGSMYLSFDAPYPFEAHCSGKALDKAAREFYGADASAADLFAAYEKKEQTACDYLAVWVKNLARGFAAVQQMMDPEVIVLGGPVVLSNPWVLSAVEEQMKEMVMGRLRETLTLKKAKFGLEAGVIGAGYLALSGSRGV